MAERMLQQQNKRLNKENKQKQQEEKKRSKLAVSCHHFQPSSSTCKTTINKRRV